MRQNQTGINSQKKIVIVIINLLVGGLHFLTGENYRGPFPIFVNGYLVDILLPFALYFLASLFDMKILRAWWARALVPFGIGLAVETAQFFGIPLFGRTFDPLDLLAYAVGALLAVLCDQVLFPRLLPFWKEDFPF